MSPHAKSTIKIVFLTLFLDLVGFSIIFPLFPALAKYYIELDPHNPFLRAIIGTVASIMEAGGQAGGVSGDALPIVLFGGIMGGLYSLLQFASAPFWGSLSDRIGRKPVLLISVAGLAASYALWFFAGSFTLLILARFIGGIMGGNMSTATAVVADVTTPANRSRGMAYVGIAFALGFIIGPALGGILSLYNPLAHFPELARYGINPFSAAAALACLLSIFNLISITARFKETLPAARAVDGADSARSERSANIIKLFKPLPYRGTNLTNWGYFLFLFIFSGMEFTLTFFAAERLHYSAMKNAYLFIFIGFILVLVQGGVVRRHAHRVGEKRMGIAGLILIIPGLSIIASAYSEPALYAGLAFLAVGSAMIIPCLTALVSLYTPPAHQGHAIGVFRSLGALARAVGPLVASILYWRAGASTAYYAGSVALLIPIALLARLRKPVAADARP